MKKTYKYFLIFFGILALTYALGRFYFYVTDGFSIKNIHMEFSSQPQWKSKSLTIEDEKKMLIAVSQPYTYLGKGCQSYVFASEDDQYVIKFFKYQHYRLPTWFSFLPPLPAFEKYREEKKIAKWDKLNTFAQGWKIAFDDLREETGLTYIHLNKTDHLHQSLEIKDKLGITHRIHLDEMQFCLQKKAERLDEALIMLKAKNDFQAAAQLIDALLTMLTGEYQRGFADNDHAILQNTGVVNGQPFHMDVGQFVYNEAVKETAFLNQELFTKTYRLKIWLEEVYPDLAHYLVMRLKNLIGPSYDQLQPNFRPQEERIQNQQSVLQS